MSIDDTLFILLPTVFIRRNADLFLERGRKMLRTRKIENIRDLGNAVQVLLQHGTCCRHLALQNILLGRIAVLLAENADDIRFVQEKVLCDVIQRNVIGKPRIDVILDALHGGNGRARGGSS